MKYIDIHSHTNFISYDEDRDKVIKRAQDESVVMITVGTQFDTSVQAVAIANKYDHCHAIIGLHPIHTTKYYHDEEELGLGNKEFTSRGEIFEIDQYRELAKTSNKIVGVGECGLDYYRNDRDTKAVQEIAFREQIKLALELDLPLMLHVRPSENSMDAYKDVLVILSEYKKEVGKKLRGDVHFFAGTIDIAQQFLDLDFDISFTGVITFAKDYEELVRFVPLDRIHAETDAPYVTPVPHRGTRNEPSYVIEIVKKIAQIKNEPLETVERALRLNANRLFSIGVDLL